MLQPDPIQFIIALDPNGRALMTRDMELIRKIFAEIQSRIDARPRPLEVPGVDEAVVARHLELLLKEGLIEGFALASANPFSPTIMVKDLSWAGHDFAAVLANDNVWVKLKKTFSASDLATLPLAIIKEAGMSLLTQWAKSKLGL